MENEIVKTLDQFTPAQKFAVGNDLVFIPAFADTFNELFRNKVYTEQEIAYCEQFDNSMLRYASTWAAKEAVYKSVKQLDKATLGWQKIEIIREKIAGRPHVVLHNHPSEFNISLTISHDGDYVWALAFTEPIL